MNKILLIVGNGLSIDIHKHLKIDLDPSLPFSFDVPDPFDKSKKLLNKLPRLKDMIESYPPDMSDYNIIQDFVKNYQKDCENVKKHCELRYYLSLAYSYEHDILLNHWKMDWNWLMWIKKNYKEIVGVVTLNYDLVLETTLDKADIKYYRIGSNEEDNPIGIPIFKPHGSCDFDIPSSGISIPENLRLNIHTFLNDNIINGRGRVKIVNKNKLSVPRTEADIVLPFEFSPQMRLTWVRQGYETIMQIAKTVEVCIVFGLSYQPCDRKEINSIIENVPKNIIILVVNPEPDEELKKKLESISKKVQIRKKLDI